MLKKIWKISKLIGYRSEESDYRLITAMAWCEEQDDLAMAKVLDGVYAPAVEPALHEARKRLATAKGQSVGLAFMAGTCTVLAVTALMRAPGNLFGSVAWRCLPLLLVLTYTVGLTAWMAYAAYRFGVAKRRAEEVRALLDSIQEKHDLKDHLENGDLKVNIPGRCKAEPDSMPREVATAFYAIAFGGFRVTV